MSHSWKTWFAAWADIEPGVEAIATIGLLAGPSLIVAALTARRVETNSGAAVTLGGLLRALFRAGRPSGSTAAHGLRPTGLPPAPPAT